MAKPRAKKKRGAKPSASHTRLPIDAKEVEQLVELTFRGDAILVPTKQPTPPAASPEGRKMQILRSFFEGIDFEQLEGDVEVMQEIQILTNRRGDDNASEAVGRVTALLESLLDTGETCGFKPGN